MPMDPRLPRFQRAVDYFYLNWLWRIAEGLRLIPRLRDRLVSSERRLACPFYDPEKEVAAAVVATACTRV